MSTTQTSAIEFSAYVHDIRDKISKAPGTVHAVDFFKVSSSFPHKIPRGTLQKGYPLKSSSGFEHKVLKGAHQQDDHFILDDEAWRKSQLYVKSSQRLPTTKQSLIVSYGDGVFEALTQPVATTLIDVYSAVAGHCSGFEDNYHQVVSLANDVVSYAKDTQTYYPEVSHLFDVIINGKDAAAQQQAANNLRSVFSGLADRTDSRATKVKTVFTYINNFKKDTDYDQGQVKNISNRVEREDSAISSKIERINLDIASKTKELKDFTSDYDAAVSKGKTTAAYVWIPIFGWIAGPIVSSQASSEAKFAYSEMQRLSGELDALDRELGHAQRLKLAVAAFSSDSHNTLSRMKDALDTLGVMTSAWLSMSDIFTELGQKLASWQEHLDYFAQLDFNAEKVKWEDLGKIAEQYVGRAFVAVDDAPTLGRA